MLKRPQILNNSIKASRKKEKFLNVNETDEAIKTRLLNKNFHKVFQMYFILLLANLNTFYLCKILCTTFTFLFKK